MPGLGPLRTVPLRRVGLGAEELLELGSPRPPRGVILSQAAAPMPPPSVIAPGAAPRAVSVSREEGKLLIQVVESIVEFAKGYPIEFISYCPSDRWQQTLTQVGSWTAEIERQLNAGAQVVNVPAEMVFRLVDLEKCISAARDARLSSAKLAFTIYGVGAIADLVFGLTWIGIPAYVAGLAVMFGRPLWAKFSPEPQEPYKPAIKGCRGNALGGCPVPHESDEEKRKPKLIERVILSPDRGLKEYNWGEVDCAGSGAEGSVCLKKGRLRVRVEGWAGDVVLPGPGWEFADDCVDSVNVIAVWDAPGFPRGTSFGAIPKKSRHPLTYWVEYVGPKTGGRIRRAGPFGCPFDTTDHAIEDAGIRERGVDGELVIFDSDGDVVDVPEEETAEATS
jgi:hypothetical protein